MDHGGQPEPPGGAHRPGHHQPGPDHRPHRAPGHRGQLHHRPGQRHGLAPVQQHHLPDGGLRLPQREPPPARGRHPGHRPGSHPQAEQLALPPDPAGGQRGGDQGLVDPGHQPGALLDRQGAPCRKCSAGWSSWSCRTCTRPPTPRSCADLLLPAGGSGEKNGTFINSERRIGMVQKIFDPPGQALPDFEIFRRIAQAWGCGPMFREWTSPEAVFQILKRLSAGQPCDFSGIRDYSMLLEKGGIQWPFPAGADPRRGGRGPAAVRGRPLLHRQRQGPAALRGHRAPARSPGRPASP